MLLLRARLLSLTLWRICKLLKFSEVRGSIMEIWNLLNVWIWHFNFLNSNLSFQLFNTRQVPEYRLLGARRGDFGCWTGARGSKTKVVELGEKRVLRWFRPSTHMSKSVKREAQNAAGPFFRGATEALPFGRLKKGPAAFCASRLTDLLICVEGRN